MAKRIKERFTITANQRIRIFRRDGYICGYCKIRRRRKPSSLAVDHIIPVQKGGYHGEINWVTACKQCNREKWHHLPKENGMSRLLWHSKKKVAKATCRSPIGRYPKRVPKISYAKTR